METSPRISPTFAPNSEAAAALEISGENRVIRLLLWLSFVGLIGEEIGELFEGNCDRFFGGFVGGKEQSGFREFNCSDCGKISAIMGVFLKP